MKITVLGGGSNFVPGFVAAICKNAEIFAGGNMCLYDLSKDRVDLIKAFSEKYVETKNVPFTFSHEEDLDAALDGADFVLINFRIGGIRAIALDETIPPRFGYFGEETASTASAFMAMRTIPVVVDVAKRMERLCPNAWLFNYANPENHVTDAVSRTTNIKIAGVCDGYIDAAGDIAILLGMEDRYLEITTRHAGLNHHGWAHIAKLGERDLLQELDEIDPAQIDENLRNLPESAPWHSWQYRNWYNPAIHMSSYYFFDEELKAQLDQERVHERPKEVIEQEHIAKRFKPAEAYRQRMRDVLADFKEEVADEIATARFAFGDLAIGAVASIIGDRKKFFPVNMPHKGIIPGFEPHTVMEMYSIAGRDGFELIAPPAFPKLIKGRLQSHANMVDLIVEGTLEKNLDLIKESICLHPTTTSINKALIMFDVLCKEEQETLGDYWK